jgi:hypothetical protein
METEVYIKDDKGRVIFKIIKERVMVSRHPDMNEYTKQQLLFLYSEFTSEDVEKLRKFLDFESDDVEFCS